MKLSTNFHLQELNSSEFALMNGHNNYPSTDHVGHLVDLATDILEPIRSVLLTHPLRIVYGYHGTRLHKYFKGDLWLPHRSGTAVGIVVPVKARADLFHWIRKGGVPFDMLTWVLGDSIQPDWIQIVYKKDRNRLPTHTVRRAQFSMLSSGIVLSKFDLLS